MNNSSFSSVSKPDVSLPFINTDELLISTTHCPHASKSPQSACYLTAVAEINGIEGIVLLDTGSGISIISALHWKIIGNQQLMTVYDGPQILGPDGSSIEPEGMVTLQISMIGVTVQQRAVVAHKFHHLLLLGNDYMKSIGLVLDIQGKKM